MYSYFLPYFLAIPVLLACGSQPESACDEVVESLTYQDSSLLSPSFMSIQYDDDSIRFISTLDDDMVSCGNQLPSLEYLRSWQEAEAKPILIYFSGNGCVNCRRFEQKLRSDRKLFEKMQKHFRLLPINTDTRDRLLDQGDNIINVPTITGVARTVGHINVEYQIALSKTGSQPVLAVVGNDVSWILTPEFVDADILNDQIDCLINSVPK